MQNNNMNKELRAAVFAKNFEKVDALLSAGADVNHTDNFSSGEMLIHCTESVEMIKKLVSAGARINGRNSYNETPLHVAITSGNTLETVRELIKNGADINTTNRRGNTALNLAVTKRYKNSTVIQELLKNGASINIRNHEREFSHHHATFATPLDNAVKYNHVFIAEMMIEYTLLKNFNKDYRRMIDLSPYKESKCYSELSAHLNECVSEIVQMKTDKIKETSLYEVVTKNSNILVLVDNSMSLKIAKTDYSKRYPIYNYIIFDQVVKPFVERADLLNKIGEIQCYTKSQDGEGKIHTLDHDSAYNITEYLSNVDLVNFIAAFEDSNKCTIQSSSYSSVVEPDIDESSTSNVAKRARLE